LAHGGKLLMYHGWADQNVSPFNTVRYFQNVRGMLGPAKTSIRLLIGAGNGHCDGPNTFGKIGALDRWIEAVKAPKTLIASHAIGGKVDRTRPLCPYP
jgi:feruloyl esterase